MISLVIPLLNEVESLPVLYEHLLKEIVNIEKNYEIIFVDDGSTDGSLDFLKQIAAKNKAVRVFSFRINQGKAEALSLGFQKAKGDFIVTMDADLEDNPKELEKLYKKIQEGFDLVSGWRKKRKHSFDRVISSKLSNFIIRIIWGLKLHDYNCGFKIYRKEVVKSIDLYGGLYRFVSLIAHLNGFNVTEIEVEHQNRRFGKSKYGFFGLWKDLPDVFTMLFLTRYGKRPLHFFGFAGTVIALIGIFILAYLTVIHFQGYAINRRPVLFLGMLLVLSGFQLYFTGFLADLIINLSDKKDKEFILKYSNE